MIHQWMGRREESDDEEDDEEVDEEEEKDPRSVKTSIPFSSPGCLPCLLHVRNLGCVAGALLRLSPSRRKCC